MQLHGFAMPGLQTCKETLPLREIQHPGAAKNNETMSDTEHKGVLLRVQAGKAAGSFIISRK